MSEERFEPYWYDWPADLVFELVDAEQGGDDRRVEFVHEMARIRELPTAEEDER